MIPSDEQVDQAIAAFDDTWRKRPDITVKNFEEARRDAMRSALQAALNPKERPREHRDLETQPESLVTSQPTALPARRDEVCRIREVRSSLHPKGESK